MATKIGYVSQPPTAQINWAEVGANFTGMLNEEARVREEKKAEIDRATNEQMKVLKNAPMGDSKNINQLAIGFSDDAQKQLLMANALLKSGDLKPRDYLLMRQNMADGTDQFFTLIQDYQNEYGNKMERLKSNDPNNSSQYLEQYLMETIEGFGNFQNSKPVINPTTGEVLVGFINPTTGEIESDPNKLVGIGNLKNRLKGTYNKYNMDAAVLEGQKLFGDFEVITRELGKKGRTGTIIKYSNPALRTKEGLAELVKNKTITQEYADGLSKFPELLDSWAESQLSMYNVSSLLTDNLRNISGKSFNYTANPAEQDENTILYKQVDGNIVLDFESEIGKKQRQIAKEGLKDVFTGALDQKIDVTPIGGEYIPPQQRTSAQIDQDNLYKEQTASFNNIAKFYSGNQAEFDEAKQYVRSINPNILYINKVGDGVEIVYADGKDEFLSFGSSSEKQWVIGNANFFLPSDKKIADVNTVWKRSGVSGDRPLNTTATGASASSTSSYEPVNTTYKRQLEAVPNFKADLFVADNENKAKENMINLLKSIPATKGWTVATDGWGNTDIIVIKNGKEELARFNLDESLGFNATDYLATLKEIIIANTKEEDKAAMIQGKQQKQQSTVTSVRAAKAEAQAKREKEFVEKQKAAAAAGAKEFEFEGKIIKVDEEAAAAVKPAP